MTKRIQIYIEGYSGEKKYCLSRLASHKVEYDYYYHYVWDRYNVYNTHTHTYMCRLCFHIRVSFSLSPSNYYCAIVAVVHTNAHIICIYINRINRIYACMEKRTQ